MARWHVLNTDASKPEASGKAAIGAVLRQKARQNAPLRVIAYISEVVEEKEIQQAEYRALIEGLKLAKGHSPTNLHVFVDSASVADQINETAKVKSDMKDLHAEARQLLDAMGEQTRITLAASRTQSRGGSAGVRRVLQTSRKRMGQSWTHVQPRVDWENLGRILLAGGRLGRS